MNCNHIDIDHREYRVSKLLGMVKDGTLVIPNVDGVDESRNSEFIEGMMIGAIPTNMLVHFNIESGNRVYTILDGRKRMKTIINFINNLFYLKGMEFITHVEGFTFLDLPNSLVRTIEDTIFNIDVIRDVYNDPEVTNSIIRRFK